MPEPLFKVELGKSMADQEAPGHNRWHPDIPAAASTDPGTDFRMECLDWTNGQVGNNDSANDIRDMDLDQNHVLSGPIHVNGAEPGDVLVVDILNMGPFPGAEPSGDTPASSPGRTAAVSSLTTTRTRTRRSGTCAASTRPPATYRT